MPLPSAREPVQEASARRTAAIGSSGWGCVSSRDDRPTGATRAFGDASAPSGTDPGDPSYHYALRCIRCTRSAQLRAVRAPLALAFVIALGALVAPAGIAAPSVHAATRSTLTTAEAADMSPATAEMALMALLNADRAAV